MHWSCLDHWAGKMSGDNMTIDSAFKNEPTEEAIAAIAQRRRHFHYNTLQESSLDNEKRSMPFMIPSCAWFFERQKQRFRHLLRTFSKTDAAAKHLDFLDIATNSSLEESAQINRGHSICPINYVRVRYDIDKPRGSSQRTEKPLIFERIEGPSSLPRLSNSAGNEKAIISGNDEKNVLKVLNSQNDTSGIMQQLVELAACEQQVFNTWTSELIRRETVECYDRGLLLAQLRETYSQALKSAPFKMLNLHQESTAQKILTKNLREEERILRIRVAEYTGDLKKNATFLDIQPGLLVRSSALETAVTMETQKSTVDTHQTLLNFACEEGDQYLKAKVLENHIYHRVLERLLMKFYNEPEGPYDNLHSQISKAILNNFRDWRRWISYALSVLKTFDEYGLNRVQRDYGCIWRTQALELSANLIERKMTAERCIHEALINLRSAFDNSCSTTKDNNGEGRPKSESAEAEPGEDSSMNLRNSIQNIEYLLELFGGEEVLNLQAKIKDVRNNTHSWVDIIIEIFFNHMDTQDGKPHPEHRVFLRLIQVLEESLNEESTTLLGDNGVANCCTNVNKNLHLIVTNLIPIRHPCPTKSAAPETDVEASRNLLERLKLKAKSCIQDLVSALNLIEASMRDVDFSEYLHFHLPREETTRDKSAPWIDDSKRQKPANGTHTKFRSDQKLNLQNALLILDNWMATLPQAIHTEFQMLEGEMDQLFAKNMHALCAFDACRVPQTTVGVKSALPERPLSSHDANNSEPETPEAVKGLDEKFTRLESRVRKYTSDVISSIKPVYENEVYCAKQRLDMSHFRTISNSAHEALDQWSRAVSSLVKNEEVIIMKEEVADLYGLSTDHLSLPAPGKESTWQESDAANELNYVDHRDTTLRRRHLLQNEARSPARVGACGTVLKHATSVLETDLAYQLQCSLPKKFDELKAITESNLQLDTQLINAEAELKSLRDENALYSAELLRVEYEIGAVLGTTERITAMASEF